MKQFIKDPDADLDYVWDWSDYLEGDTIDTYSITIPVDLTLGAVTHLDGVVTAFISGGTLDKANLVTCTITTAGGRKDERSAIFLIKNK